MRQEALFQESHYGLFQPAESAFTLSGQSKMGKY